MNLLKRLEKQKQQQDERMTFHKFIKLTQKRQLDKIWQVKNKIHMRKQIKQKMDNKIHIIPSAFIEGLKGYRTPHTINTHIQSNRFPKQLTPPKRMHSQQIARKKDQQYKVPNLKLSYRRDEINTIKYSENHCILPQIVDNSQQKIKKIRLSLPIDFQLKSMDVIKIRQKQEQISPNKTNRKAIKSVFNPESRTKN